MNIQRRQLLTFNSVRHWRREGPTTSANVRHSTAQETDVYRPHGPKHSMDVVRKVVQHLNTGQTPVVTFDQPLYAIVKQIQWKWSEMYGEDKFVVVFGGLHIEIAALGKPA